MPEKKTTRPKRKAKSPSAQAGEYVREEIEHVREGKHGARSAKQVIAIGLSRARRAGVKIPPPPGKKAPKPSGRKPDPTRSRAALQALKAEGTAAASPLALSRHARRSAEAAARHDAAVKAPRTRAKRGRPPNR